MKSNRSRSSRHHPHALTEISNVTVSASINSKTKLIEKQTVTLKKRHHSETADWSTGDVTTSTTTYISHSDRNNRNVNSFSPNNKKRLLLSHHNYHHAKHSGYGLGAVPDLKASGLAPQSSSSNNGRIYRKKRLVNLNLNLEVSPVKKFLNEVSGMKNSRSSYSLLLNNSGNTHIDDNDGNDDASCGKAKGGSFLDILFGSSNSEKKIEFSVVVDQFKKKLPWSNLFQNSDKFDESENKPNVIQAPTDMPLMREPHFVSGVTKFDHLHSKDVINKSDNIFSYCSTNLQPTSEKLPFFIEPSQINYIDHHQTLMDSTTLRNNQHHHSSNKENDWQDEGDVLMDLLLNDTLMDSEDEEVADRANRYDVDDGRYFHFEPFEHFLGNIGKPLETIGQAYEKDEEQNSGQNNGVSSTANKVKISDRDMGTNAYCQAFDNEHMFMGDTTSGVVFKSAGRTRSNDSSNIVGFTVSQDEDDVAMSSRE